MPEFTVIHFGLLGLALAIGIAAGWRVRADRCAKEKIAVNASWQDKIESQRSEHGSLTEQNKSLMEQISQHHAAEKDHVNLTKELSDSLREAFSQRDELQLQLKDIRNNLKVAIDQHDDLPRHQQEAGTKSAPKEKDEKIFRLSRELTSWENRVPPLVEGYMERSKEVAVLREELQAAQTRLQDLEARAHSSDTQIQPVNVQSLPDGGTASNKPFDTRPVDDTPEIIDQIEPEILLTEEGTGHVDLEEDDVIKNLGVGAIFSDDEEGETAAAFDGNEPLDVVATSNHEGEEADSNDVEEEMSTAVSAGRDDLKMIKGIGPAIEKTLNDCGIHLFHQIAEMSEYDIDRVAHQIKGFRSRIYREDWIGQARYLQNDKANTRF